MVEVRWQRAVQRLAACVGLATMQLAFVGTALAASESSAGLFEPNLTLSKKKITTTRTVRTVPVMLEKSSLLYAPSVFIRNQTTATTGTSSHGKPYPAEQSALAQATVPQVTAGEQQSVEQRRKPPKDAAEILPRDNTPAEYNLFRENVATLSGGSLEMSAGISYMKNNAFVQGDRAYTANVGARYGLLNGIEIGVNVPYYYSVRQSSVGPGLVDTETVKSLGDIQAQVTALVFKETADWPSINVTGGVTFPTGEKPYAFGPNYVVSANPIDPLYNRQSRGQWGAFGAVQFVKVIDPIVLFFGFGFDNTFDSNIDGHTVSWPTKFTYSTGLAFAVSDKTTLGFSVVGSYQPSLKVDGVQVPQSGSEPIVARFVLDQRLAKNFWLEPSLGIGLSSDAPNLLLSLTGRYRFDAPAPVK